MPMPCILSYRIHAISRFVSSGDISPTHDYQSCPIRHNILRYNVWYVVFHVSLRHLVWRTDLNHLSAVCLISMIFGIGSQCPWHRSWHHSPLYLPLGIAAIILGKGEVVMCVRVCVCVCVCVCSLVYYLVYHEDNGSLPFIFRYFPYEF